MTGCLSIHGQLHIVEDCISEVVFSIKHGQGAMLGQLTSQEMLQPQL